MKRSIVENKFIKICMVLLVAATYLHYPDMHPSFDKILIITAVSSGCIIVISAVRMQFKQKNDTENLIKAIMIFKLSLLPIYAFLHRMIFALSLAVLTVWFAPPAIVGIALYLVYGGFLLFVSSCLSISQTIILYRKGRLRICDCILHILLQMLFVTDVIDCIIVFIITREKRQQQAQTHPQI